ncbi:hypothetical protein Q5H93_21580 [Hymenobacter sp. ASUV-10]|uniref:Uncharacterized protein n=1 Tax=Hymenobacter aranciens TaxID=3063996 RepID=A0ABT9BGH5_9BACT|nr:hypothetical protein [Hymenobacter sp. ASUV-10]MDO7877351.1 hypothetical protein [Hymenobacter sp. ASUV-10]
MQTNPKPESLAKLLPEGEVTRMAREAGVSLAAVSKALKRQRPGNRFVQKALCIARETGTLQAAQDIQSLKPVA